VCLSALGQTINIMTLGGLALAVGILVNNAKVTIENINSHLEQGKAVEPAILDGAQQIALPMLVSTLAICIVFVPMFMLTGIAGYLFVPFAEAVVFAMLASYLLSLTLVPTLAKYWLKPHEAQATGHGVLARFQAGFDRLRKRYHTLLEAALRSGPRFADIYLTLGPNHHPTATYVSLLRHKLSALYPSTSFAFLPADINSQILNFGLPSPLDIQISGPNVDADRQYADLLLQKVRAIPGAVDVRIQQAFDYPQLNVNVDRSKARLVGLTQSDVASNLLVSLSGSFQTSPSFWMDPNTGTQYSVATQTPQYRLSTLNDLAATPLRPSSGAPSQMLSNVAVFHRSAAPGVVSHYNAVPVIDIYGSVQGTDLGFMSAQVNKIIAASRHDLPRGAQVFVRGQV